MSDAVSRLNAALEGRYAIERELGEGGMARKVRVTYGILTRWGLRVLPLREWTMTNRRFEGIDIFAILLSLSIFGCGGGDNPVDVTVVTLERVAFESGRDGNFEIYVMDADGSNQVNLTNNAANTFFPAWSLVR